MRGGNEPFKHVYFVSSAAVLLTKKLIHPHKFLKRFTKICKILSSDEGSEIFHLLSYLASGLYSYLRDCKMIAEKSLFNITCSRWDNKLCFKKSTKFKALSEAGGL